MPARGLDHNSRGFLAQTSPADPRKHATITRFLQTGPPRLTQDFNKNSAPFARKGRRLFCAHIKHGCHTTLSTTRCCLASEVCVTVPRSQCVLVSAHCHICFEFSLGCQGFCLQLGGVHPLRASPGVPGPPRDPPGLPGRPRASTGLPGHPLASPGLPVLPRAGCSYRCSVPPGGRGGARPTPSRSPSHPRLRAARGPTAAGHLQILSPRCYTPGPEQIENPCREVADRPAEVLHARPGTKREPLPGGGRSSR
jgi:hypothetical protein